MASTVTETILWKHVGSLGLTQFHGKNLKRDSQVFCSQIVFPASFLVQGETLLFRELSCRALQPPVNAPARGSGRQNQPDS